MANHFRVTRHFGDKDTEWPQNDIEHYGQRYPIYMLQLYPSSKFTLFLLYSQLFSSYRPVWDKYNDLKMISTLKSQGTSYSCDNYPRAQNFNPFRSMARRFRVTDHFEISALNDTKWNWTQ